MLRLWKLSDDANVGLSVKDHIYFHPSQCSSEYLIHLLSEMQKMYKKAIIWACVFCNKIRQLVYAAYMVICTLADSGFFKNFQHQCGVKSKVSKVFENLEFKISECYEQN